MAATRNSTDAEAAHCALTDSDTGPTLTLSGAWRLPQAPELWQRLQHLSLASPLRIDGSGLVALDSAAALLLLRALQRAGVAADSVQWHGFDPAHHRILAGVPWKGQVLNQLAGLGRRATALGALLLGHLNFLGAVLAAMAQPLVQPRQLRMRELAVQFEQVCVNAIPVVALVTALIGVTIAYLLGLQAEKYLSLIHI
jgi:phospholipid/cholesterol/gamma-HCH transport system permease protein